ncbi:MAG: hypothetical protein FWD54_00870 [Endomicrobia bacterium]|nr:hypothetical protein [Endomicrobiia bacterium]MCL2798825.1 hypothetical protein [Endomicrobiia bacterium]
MRKSALLSLSIIFLFAAKAFALFDASFWGVRAMGMGGAFTAVSDDVNAPGYNIAGIAGMESPEVTAMSAKLFSGLDGLDMSAQYIEGVYPISKKAGSVALGWSHFGDAGLRSEDMVNLGYANNVYKNDWIKLLLGANLKYLRQAVMYMGDDLSNSAFGIDLGVLARFKHGISVGYSGKYLNSPDIGLKDTDNVPRTNTVGLAYYNEKLPYLDIPHFTVAMDYEIRDSENTLMLGMESRLINDTLAVRAGGWSEQLNFGLGYKLKFGKDEKNNSALSIDYALGLPLKVQDTIGSHFFSLSYRFN